jgi:RNA polymerase sigma-B factor
MSTNRSTSLVEQRQHQDDKPLATAVAGWCEEYARTRDPELRRMIIERHHWLAQICARQMRRRDEPLDDLVQTAEIALIMALDRFDPTYGVAFRTFASATILGELRRYYRSTWRVRVPRRVQELHLSVSKAIEELTASLQRSPKVEEIAAHLAVDRDSVLEALAAGLTYWPVPLQSEFDEEGDAILGVDGVGFEEADSWAELSPLLEKLPRRERTILYLRFFRELTQTEIAEQMQMSQVHVSRLMRKALETLRSMGQENSRRVLAE